MVNTVNSPREIRAGVKYKFNQNETQGNITTRKLGILNLYDRITQISMEIKHVYNTGKK